MNTLYQRRNQVFTANSANSGCILDARLHWTAGGIVSESLTSSVVAQLSPGASIITDITYVAGSSCKVDFAAQNPIKPDIYYSASVSCNILETTSYEQYIVVNEAYLVNNLVYCVRATTYGRTDIYSNINWGGGYILIDLTNSCNTQPKSGDILEPFNTIFDPVLDSGSTPPAMLYGSSGSVIMSGGYVAGVASGNIFTNNPVSGGELINPYYTFNIAGNVLSLEKTPEAELQQDSGYIKSINGIPPANGNINIQVLG